MIEKGDNVIVVNDEKNKNLKNEIGTVIGVDYGRDEALVKLERFKGWFKRESLSKTTTKPTGKYKKLGKEIGQIVDEKNEAYGDSFAVSGDFLELLYPNGIKPKDYTDALCLVRIFDKCKRIATRKDVFDESPYRDIAGYALLGAMKDSDNND